MAYTEQQIMNAIARAKLDGNDAVVAELTAMLPAEPQKLRSVAQGMTFGFGDEIEAAARAPFSDRSYRDIRDEIRGGLEAYRADSPIEAALFEVGGGLLTGGVGGAKAISSLGLRNASRLRQLVGLGAAEGALQGAGIAEEMSDIPLNAAIGASLGAPMGAVGRGIEKGVTRTARSRVGREIQEAMRRDGLDQDQALARLQDLGDEGMLADISPAMAGKARGVALQPGPGKGIAEQALDSRQAGQIGRIKSALGEDDFSSYLAGVRARLKGEAAPFYADAYDSTITRISPRMSRALNTKEGRIAWKQAMDRVASRRGIDADTLEKMSPGSMPDVWDQFTRRLRGMAGAARRSGDNDMASSIMQQLDEVNEDLLKQVPKLREARRIYSNYAAMEEAAEQGKKLLRGSFDIDAHEIRQLSAAEKESFVRGAVRAIFEKMDNSIEDANVARNLLKTNSVRRRLRAAFKDQTQYNRFMKQLEAEAQMGKTFSEIRRGSRTAPAQFEARDTRGTLGIMADVLQGNWAQAAGSAANRALGAQPQISPAVSEGLANALFAKGPLAQQSLLQAGKMAIPRPGITHGLLTPGIQQTTGLLLR